MKTKNAFQTPHLAVSRPYWRSRLWYDVSSACLPLSVCSLY